MRSRQGWNRPKPGNQAARLSANASTPPSTPQVLKRQPCGYASVSAYAADWGERTISFRRGDTTVLQPGMTFHFMPALWLELTAGWNHRADPRSTETGYDASCTTPANCRESMTDSGRHPPQSRWTQNGVIMGSLKVPYSRNDSGVGIRDGAQCTVIRQWAQGRPALNDRGQTWGGRRWNTRGRLALQELAISLKAGRDRGPRDHLANDEHAAFATGTRCSRDRTRRAR